MYEITFDKLDAQNYITFEIANKTAIERAIIDEKYPNR